MSSRPAQVLLIGLLATTCWVAAGCGRHTEGANTPVIIIGLDTFRGDFIGRDDVQTPNLDALISNSVYFPDCRSTSPWTGPSFASIFTGLLPYHHGFLGGKHLRLADKNVTVAEYFQDEKRPTAAFVTIGWLTSGFGMAQGYDTGTKIADHADGEASKEVVRRGLEFARQHEDESFYLFLHFFDAHAPYTPPAPFDGMYYHGDRDAPGPALVDFLKSDRNQVFNVANKAEMYDWLEGVTDMNYPIAQYAAGISYVDHMVGQAVAGLKQAGLYDKALIVVVGDHGEHLGEHQLYFTHSMPFEEAIHVPLIIKWPENEHAGVVVDKPVSTVDILPTLLAVTGRSRRAPMDGNDLTPRVVDPTADSAPVILAEEGAGADRFVKTLVVEPWKLTVYWFAGKRVPTLFDLTRDPGETTDVAADNPEVVERMMQRLGEIIDLDQPYTLAPALPPRSKSPETLKRLRSLGYVN